MKIEDYKSYMERVETTTEMDERVLKNLKNSVSGERRANKHFLQQIMKHTRTFIYRASVAAVCLLVLVVIGKSYTGVEMSDGNSQSEKVTPKNTSAVLQKDAPTFADLYGQTCSAYATQCNYVNEDDHVRFCITEAISDGCIAEILGYYECKDATGKKWLQEHTENHDFTVYVKPEVRTWAGWPDAEANKYAVYDFQDGENQREKLEKYNTPKRTYFDSYFVNINHPLNGCQKIIVDYRLYGTYNQTVITLEKQMRSKPYLQQENNKDKEKGKHYQIQEVILSPLGGLMVIGKDLGIKACSLKSADNFSTLYLNRNNALNKNVSLIEKLSEKKSMWTGAENPLYVSDTWLGADILSKEEKEALNQEYPLLSLRLNIDTDSIESIEVDGITYVLTESAGTY